MKKLALIATMAIVVIGGCYWIGQDNARLQKEIYAILEQDTLTQEEKDRVMFATDPDEMKESFVPLDDRHAALFEQHMGRKR